MSLETDLSCVFVSLFKDFDSRDAEKAGLIFMVASKRCPGPEGESLSNVMFNLRFTECLKTFFY